MRLLLLANILTTESSIYPVYSMAVVKSRALYYVITCSRVLAYHLPLLLLKNDAILEVQVGNCALFSRALPFLKVYIARSRTVHLLTTISTFSVCEIENSTQDYFCFSQMDHGA